MGSIYKEENKYGKITVSDNVIANLIASEISKYNGGISITNSKGKVIPKLYKSMGVKDLGNIQIERAEDGRLNIKFHVVLKFGMSIRKTTDDIIENIRKQIKIATDREPAAITLVITGVISKKLARRNIEIVKRYDDR